MYSYDVERIRQMAALIRKKGAKKPQRPPKKLPKPRRKTAVGSKNVAGKGDKEDAEGVKAKQSTKVQFTLPGQDDMKDSSDKKSKTASEAGTLGKYRASIILIILIVF